MTQIYEGMFLLDNEVVRQDWKRAKGIVTGTLEKHGATVHAARRWDERRLAYPIDRRRRATYLLTYYEVPSTNVVNLRRDFELSEPILRYLITSTESVPAKELELSELEKSADFVAPPPPEDDAAEQEEQAALDVADDVEDMVGDELDDYPRRRSVRSSPRGLDEEAVEAPGSGEKEA